VATLLGLSNTAAVHLSVQLLSKLFKYGFDKLGLVYGIAKPGSTYEYSPVSCVLPDEEFTRSFTFTPQKKFKSTLIEVFYPLNWSAERVVRTGLYLMDGILTAQSVDGFDRFYVELDGRRTDILLLF
jgi:sRNA-binding regulator protein Hfq